MEDANNNREYLKIVLDYLYILASQGLAMRGHDGSIDSINKGNFLELLDRLKNIVRLYKSFCTKKKRLPILHPQLKINFLIF